MPKRKPKYFPNNWKAYKDSPDDFFIPLSYNDFFNWKVMGWALPSSVACVIREEKNGKISERIYSQSGAAHRYLENQMADKSVKTVFTICDDSAVQVLYPRTIHHKYQNLEMDDIWDEDLFDEETGNYED